MTYGSDQMDEWLERVNKSVPLRCRIFGHKRRLIHVEGSGARLILFGGVSKCARCGR